MKDLFCGKLVRLSAPPPDLMSKSFTQWDRDTEIHRLANTNPVQLWSEKKIKEFIEKDAARNNPQMFRFSICTLSENRFIGGVSLWLDSWADREAWLGIRINDRDYLGRGYGTDAMRLITQYGFLELNLRRISLAVHDFNERALRTYLKVGFQMEGKMRGEGKRDGVLYDCFYLGLLREEWEAR